MGVSLKEIHFTPIQRRMVSVLKDGRRHPRKEVKDCIGDEYSSSDAFQKHIKKLREKLNPIGVDIVCIYRNRLYYQMVILFQEED